MSIRVPSGYDKIQDATNGISALIGGDGINYSNPTITIDLTTNGGLVIDGSNKVKVDLDATSITGTLSVGKGGTGATTLTTGQFVQANGANPFTTTKAVPNGDVVGTSDTQTLTNKTIDLANNTVVGSLVGSLTDLTDVTINSGLRTHGQVLTFDKTIGTSGEFANSVAVWKDLLGALDFRTGGGTNAPSVSVFRDSQVGYACKPGNSDTTDFYMTYHIPHDWKPGTNCYLHVHHSTNSASETGTVKFVATVSFAAINGIFTPDVTLADITHTYDGTQYKHIVSEVPMGVPGGLLVNGLINTSNIEVDTVILVRVRRLNIADSVATNNGVFVFMIDIHYESHSNVGTFSRSPPFNS